MVKILPCHSLSGYFPNKIRLPPDWLHENKCSHCSYSKGHNLENWKLLAFTFITTVSISDAAVYFNLFTFKSHHSLMSEFRFLEDYPTATVNGCKCQWAKVFHNSISAFKLPIIKSTVVCCL